MTHTSFTIKIEYDKIFLRWLQKSKAHQEIYYLGFFLIKIFN
jgi:hypothetical protein